ncbi:hypothetical protein BDN72DRAFT_837606 [Pluteus cervinus]|uniref:Uncharacterized protein n=1 Tax=Pluteus cervinus TaxID=181527 RepID=A0ACD3B1A8_9AGAR|nr:hypothetical protein BDN72DRAFT_837606 [Pluteus cervinus]
MKGIQKRIYSALPRVSSPTTAASPSRVRSNSLYTSNSILPLNFFDSPPPPPANARPTISSTRLSIESKAQSEAGSHHSHPSLALTAPANNASTLALSITPAQSALFPYTNFAPSAHPITQAATHEAHPAGKRQRKRYQLDVAAYGIPKRSKPAGRDAAASLINPRAAEDANLAVQVGEDAYFIRDNAMGVADGVGGWAKSKHNDLSLTSQSPSAMFSKRLMHYCAAEIETASRQVPSSPPPPFFSTACPPRKVSSKPKLPDPSPFAHAEPWYWTDTTPSAVDLEADLEESLEDLEEGIDVLMILERAYEQTIKAHVVPVPPTPPTHDPASSSVPMSSVSFSSTSNATSELAGEPHTIPLRSGSSTALIAVLDYIPRSPSSKQASYAGYDAVIKIAHLGDCMGMLVRGDDIAWRSDEMWWNFNTPVQLSPPGSSASHVVTPSTAAHLFTLPVLADDILILASDGLSDNLWDEDVLDEVVRFRHSFLGPSQSSDGDMQGSSGAPNGETSPPANTAAERLLRRRTLAGMLSEALCSRARRVSERKRPSRSATDREAMSSPKITSIEEDDEIPFARRAREAGKSFSGGKRDDISVIVAVISPAGELATS